MPARPAAVPPGPLTAPARPAAVPPGPRAIPARPAAAPPRPPPTPARGGGGPGPWGARRPGNAGPPRRGVPARPGHGPSFTDVVDCLPARRRHLNPADVLAAGDAASGRAARPRAFPVDRGTTLG